MATEARKRAWTKYNRSEKKKAARRRYYLTHKEEIAAANKLWVENNKERHLERRRRWRKKKGPAYMRAIENKRPLVKRKASDALNNAIKSGKLKKQPCMICGEIKVEAHHYDYTKPLEVEWLCMLHHRQLHKELL